MAVGEVGFHHPDRIRKVDRVEKDREMLRTLYRTKIEKSPNLEGASSMHL